MMYIYFPEKQPMSYYYGSVLGKIKRIIENETARLKPLQRGLKIKP